ncbi:MAG TPA: dihydropteroate synthase [Tepidisphaeraceae bacterium]|jgi:dihydropteroate synthase|nr:dihydropteroate synthase [Tepidisphaeraceae bacterium]
MSPPEFHAWLSCGHRRPLVMGVINLTPDSFSDGGRISGPEEAAECAQEMVAAGADWIDVGGESTRPGSAPVPAEEQIRRTAAAISAIRRRLDTVISIDTREGRVAERAADEGADIVNDISAGRQDPGMLAMVARRKLAVILMHMQGTPQTMQAAPDYSDVTAEVQEFLVHRRLAAVEAGIDRSRILFDPGIGFGKNVSHNLQLLRDTEALVELGQPLVVGPSRKSFIGRILGESRPEMRIFGTAASVAWCLANGAAVLRVHDVGPISQVVRMMQAIFDANRARIPQE